MQTGPEGSQLLRVHEAARRLSLREATVRRWLLTRRIAAVRVGRAVRIPLAEVERIIAEGFTPARDLP